MAAEDHLSEQFMYHVTPYQNRESIQSKGLVRQGKRVYLHPDPDLYHSHFSGVWKTRSAHDVWRVNVSGIPHREDLIDRGGSRYVQRDIPPERLTLHKAGGGNGS